MHLYTKAICQSTGHTDPLELKCEFWSIFQKWKTTLCSDLFFFGVLYAKCFNADQPKQKLYRWHMCNSWVWVWLKNVVTSALNHLIQFYFAGQNIKSSSTTSMSCSVKQATFLDFSQVTWVQLLPLERFVFQSLRCQTLVLSKHNLTHTSTLYMITCKILLKTAMLYVSSDHNSTINLVKHNSCLLN